MKEIERAINLISEGEIDYSGIYDCELNERVTKVILHALHEQVERGKGCEYCLQREDIDRLSDYEDTNLTPEAINTLAKSQIATAKHNVELQEELENVRDISLGNAIKLSYLNQQIADGKLVEVVHAHWNECKIRPQSPEIYTAFCSRCGTFQNAEGQYCMCCGAKMDGVCFIKK